MSASFCDLLAVPSRAIVVAQFAAVPLSFPAEYARRAALAALVVDVAALASVWRSRAHSLKARLLWTAVVALLPVVGAAAWFVLGRERRVSHRHG